MTHIYYAKENSFIFLERKWKLIYFLCICKFSFFVLPRMMPDTYSVQNISIYFSLVHILYVCVYFFMKVQKEKFLTLYFTWMVSLSGLNSWSWVIDVNKWIETHSKDIFMPFLSFVLFIFLDIYTTHELDKIIEEIQL